MYYVKHRKWILFIFSIVVGIENLGSIAFGDDTVPPQLVAFDFTPTNIDTTNGPASISVSGRLTDDVSGFAFGYIRFRSPSNTQDRFFNLWG